MPDIEQLNIQISGSSRKASNAITSLIQNLNTLRQNLTNFSQAQNISGLGNIASGLNSIANASKNVNSEGLKALTNSIGKLVSQGENLKNLDLSSLSGINIRAEQFGGITALASSLGKLTGSNVETANKTLPALASSLKALETVNIPNFGADIYVLADGLSKLGSKAMGRAQGLPELARGLRELSDIKEVPSLPGLAELAASLSKMGGKYATQAIQNIPDLAMSFNYLVSTVSKAPQVSQETLRLAEAMAQLATASRAAGQGTQQSSTGINMIRGAVSAALPSFNKAQKKTFSLASMFGKLYASYFLVIRAFRGIGGAIENASKLTEVGNVVATVFGKEKEVLEDFADTAIMNFGMAELSAKQFASRFQAMGSAMELTNKQVAQANEFLDSELQGQKRIVDGVADSYENLGKTTADMSINLTKLVADYASFYDVDYEDVAKDFESIFTGQTRPMRAYGIDLTAATIKEWALKEGLDADIESMTQAEKTMLRYQYVMAHSGKVMNDFAITADSWANVIRNIGQLITQIGVKMGSGLINIFKPALIGFRDFLNTFLGLAEKGMNAVGKLLGWQIKLDEVGVSMEDEMSDYADDLGDAAGNAKKLNSQLRAIDELNNLTSSNKGGSGSGGLDLSAGASGATGGGIKFEEVPGVFESDINSWKELGERIRDKILDGFHTIQWEDISGKVKLNASGFANLINGLLEPDEAKETIGGAFGKFIAEGINLGFDWLVTFTKDLDWEQVGGNIADFVNNFFENIDAKDMADTVDNLVDGIWKIFKTALVGDKDKEIKGIDGQKIVSTIAEFISNLDWDTRIILIKALKFKLLSASVVGVGKWFLGTGIKQLFEQWLQKNLSGAKVSPTVNISPKFTFSGWLGNTAFGKVLTADNPSVAEAWGAGIGGKIATGLSAIFAAFGGTRIGLGLGESLQLLANDDTFGGADYEKYYKPFGQVDFIKDWIIALKDYYVEMDGLKADWESLLDEFFGEGSMFQSIFGEGSMFYDVGSFFENLGFNAKEKFKEAFTGHTGGGGGTSFGESGNEDGEEYANGFDEGGSSLYEEGGFWAKLGGKIKELSQYIQGKDSIFEQMKNNGNDAANSLDIDFNGSEGFWAKLWNKGNEVGNKIYGQNGFWQKFFKKGDETTKNLGLSIYGEEGFWAKVRNKGSEVGNFFYDPNEGLWAKIYNNGNKFFTDLGLNIYGENGFWAQVWDKASEIWNDIKKLFDDGFDIKMPHFSWDADNGYEVTNKAVKAALEFLKLPTKIPALKVDWYAQGGFPETGSLFFAGEAGAEILGTVGGKTTVAGGAEITGISDTIRQTSSEEIQLLRQQNQLLQDILQKEFGISKNDLYKSVISSDNEHRKRTGRSAFA